MGFFRSTQVGQTKRSVSHTDARRPDTEIRGGLDIETTDHKQRVSRYQTQRILLQPTTKSTRTRSATQQLYQKQVMAEMINSPHFGAKGNSRVNQGGSAHEAPASPSACNKDEGPSVHVSIKPVVDPFDRPRSHTTAAATIKMVVVGLVLVVPRVVLSLAIIITAWIFSLLLCLSCGDTEPRTADGNFPLYPRVRSCFRLYARVCARLWLFVWGFYWISVDHEEVETLPDGAPEPSILVVNHTCFVDPLVAFYLTGCIAGVTADFMDVPMVGRIFNALQLISVRRDDPNSRKLAAPEILRRARWAVDQPKEVVDTYGVWPPILMFPESTCTNGTAMIRFRRGAFQPLVPVRAMCITFPNCWHDPSWVSAVSLGGIFCRMLCQVYNRCHVRYIGDISPPPPPPPARSSPAGPEGGGADVAAAVENEYDADAHADAFADKARHVFARVLCVPVTDHSFDDVVLDYDAIDYFGDDYRLGATMQLAATEVDVRTARRMLKLFAGANAAKDGHLVASDLAQLLGLTAGPASATGKDNNDNNYPADIAAAVLAAWDDDRSGTVEFVDFIRAAGMTRADDNFVKCFAEFDSDADGRLTSADFARGMLRAAPEQLAQCEHSIASSLFADIAGASEQTIGQGEFVAFCNAHEHLMHWVAASVRGGKRA